MSALAQAAPAPATSKALSLARRLLFPSYSDLFFVCVIIWSFLAGANGWERLLLDGDTGIHIRIGDYILANHRVPTEDLFSFSRPGERWYAFEWLSEVAFSAVHGRVGLKGVVLLAGLVIAASVTILLCYTLWRGANGFIALGLVLMAINASMIHFHARPHIFTLLFLTISIWLLAMDRRKRSHAVWLLVPLTALWTNMHGGFFLFLALLGLLVAGTALETWVAGGAARSNWSDTIRYAGLSLACALASLINPYGIKLPLHIIEILRSKWIVNLVHEFQSPSFRSEQLLHFMVLLFLGLAMLIPLVEKRRVTEALWILFLAYCSLVSVRHVTVFVLVAAPIIAEELSARWASWVRAQKRQSVPRILDAMAAQVRMNFRPITLWTPLAVAILALTGSVQWPADFPAEFFPVKLIRRHADQIASSRIFTSDQWSGYLIYCSYPRQRVFMDGRHNYYGESIAKDYMNLIGGHYKWRDVIKRYQFDLVLCDVESPLATLMRSDAGWKVVEDDGKAVLFQKQARL